MKKLRFGFQLVFASVLLMITDIGQFSLRNDRAMALPGQTVDQAAAWIQANSALRPASGETLLVRKSDTPARRFSFEALTASPGRAAALESRGTIRTERITLFDMTNGVTFDRLASTLRSVYGDDIYQDFVQGNLVYRYPTEEQQQAATNRDTPLLESVQGEIRQGDRYAYWMETAQTRSGEAYSGQIYVFLPEDINKLETELRDRS
ncbi:hypothetical protein [Leptolyngbya sp. FACHB-711]|uniref:hypothetical protein n=1 Tax=unclassified Leptolyngbya TaxID=2650499 RepID=UPI0018EF65C0|nr:hypothetical protein [Leptolyngbya sp. FACHB-711]